MEARSCHSGRRVKHLTLRQFLIVLGAIAVLVFLASGVAYRIGFNDGQHKEVIHGSSASTAVYRV